MKTKIRDESKPLKDIPKYDHSKCLHCGNTVQRPYSIINEIKNILLLHQVPLTTREIKRYLGNANYDKLNQYIDIEQEHLQELLDTVTEVEIIKYKLAQSVYDHDVYYSTRTNVQRIRDR